MVTLLVDLICSECGERNDQAATVNIPMNIEFICSECDSPQEVAITREIFAAAGGLTQAVARV